MIVPPTPDFLAAGVISAAPPIQEFHETSPPAASTVFTISRISRISGRRLSFKTGRMTAYGYLATALAGVSVTFDGVPAPMFLSWGGQLNFQVPFEVAGKTSTQVVVNYLGSASAPVTVPVVPSQPLFFTFPGTTNVKAYNLPSYTLNTAQTPAPRGSYVEVYGTGVGKATYTVFLSLGAPTPPSCFTVNYTYSIGGSAAAPALFGGWTPTAVGLAQWDLQIPTGIGTGAESIPK